MQHDHPITIISKIQLLTGSIASTQEDILDAFCSSYDVLYTSTLPTDFCPHFLAPMLDQVAFGWLTVAERSALSSPFNDS